MSRPRCSQHQVGFMFVERSRKLIILVSAVKDGGGSVTIWAAISWYSFGLVITLSGQITASDYVDILGNQVHLVFQRLFLTMQFFISSPVHLTGSVQSWFDKHGDALQHLPWPAQSSNLNIIGPLWSVFESTASSRFLSPIILQATSRCSSWSVVQFSTRDYSELMWVFS